MVPEGTPGYEGRSESYLELTVVNDRYHSSQNKTKILGSDCTGWIPRRVSFHCQNRDAQSSHISGEYREYCFHKSSHNRWCSYCSSLTLLIEYLLVLKTDKCYFDLEWTHNCHDSSTVVRFPCYRRPYKGAKGKTEWTSLYVKKPFQIWNKKPMLNKETPILNGGLIASIVRSSYMITNGDIRGRVFCDVIRYF